MKKLLVILLLFFPVHGAWAEEDYSKKDCKKLTQILKTGEELTAAGCYWSQEHGWHRPKDYTNEQVDVSPDNDKRSNVFADVNPSNEYRLQE